MRSNPDSLFRALIPRRTFIRDAASAAAYLVAASSAPGRSVPRRFAPVKVSRNRLIREVVGLRPFREQGYEVNAVRLGSKTVIHNYGHGGAGITLSWGTASQAVDLVKDLPLPASRGRRSAGPRRFAVIGCGVNGLSTAITLQRKYQNGPGTVTIYAKDVPPNTTSNIAGGFWSPSSVFDSDAASPAFLEKYRAAARISNRAFQLLVGREYGVRWIDTFEMYRAEPGTLSDLTGGNDLYPNQAIHRDPETYFGHPYVRQFSTMLIEPSIYLAALLRDFYTAGGRLVVREISSREEVLRLPEAVIFNCTGLGARVLFGDENLIPVRGQLEILLPQPEVDYCYLARGHMFPRSDGIVLGGTFDRNDWSLTVNTEQRNRIIDTHAEIMRNLRPNVTVP